MMIAWINFVVLIVSTVLTLHFYVRSAGPAALEKKIGAIAYARCTLYRIAASLFMTVAGVNYVIYYFYPLPVPLPRTFPWSWWISAVTAALIAIPSGYLLWHGMKDAGEESLIVKKEHTLYGGIYETIRHPQALGELPFWWVVAFLLHSPFLALFSLIWMPIFVWMCWAEEQDLLIRYGKAYEEYRSRTGFLMPRKKPKPLADTDPSRGLLRMAVRLPIWLYRARLGWLLGDRFLMLTHIGRNSGLPRHAVVEVVRHDKASGAYTIASGWGERADWFRNIRKTPAVVVQVGNRRFEATATRLSVAAAERELLDYAHRHPIAFRELSSLMTGQRLKRSEENCQRMAQLIPLVVLYPKSVAG